MTLRYFTCLMASLVLAVAAFPVYGLEAVSGTQVALDPPDGFVPADLFAGFEYPGSGCSIMVTELPMSIDLLLSGMTSEDLAKRGMTLLASEPTTFAGLSGLLLFVTQEAEGTMYNKWLGVFGSAEATAMVVATFPESEAARLGDQLKAAVLSAEMKPKAEIDNFDGLAFRIDETPELTIANRMGNMLILTGNGQMDAGPEDPLLIVGSAHSPFPIEDVEAFSRSRILQTAQVKSIREIEGQPITIDGVPGWELTAKANDEQTGVPMVLFQVVLPTQGTYYIIQGLVGEPAAAKYVPEFKTVTGSLTFTE